jgi:hypothetical protein
MHNQLKLHYSGVVILLGCLGIPGGAPAQVGLGLAPMRLELRLAAGAQHSGAVNLTSDSQGPVRVVVEPLDFFIDSSGSPQFSQSLASEQNYTCRDWLAINPMEMELSPGGQTPVRYTVRVPQSAAERSYHCAVGFTTVPTAGDLQTTGLKSAVRIVEVFYVIVGHPATDGAVDGLTLRYIKDGPQPGWNAVVSIQNRGLMYFRPSGDLEVLDESGKVVESAHFIPMPVLPQRLQDFLFPLKLAGGPGPYTLRARVDLGGDEIQEAAASVRAERQAP